MSPWYIANEVTEDNKPPSHPNTARGSQEHDEAEKLLKGERKRTRNEHVRGYVDFAKKLPGKRLGIEIKAPVFYRPEKWCYTDYATYDAEEKHLHILDLKTGAKRVEAYQNLQLAIYAISLIEHLGFMLDVEKVTLHIYMSREVEEFRAASWETDLLELGEIKDFLTSKHEIVSSGDKNLLEFVPTEDGCRFCDARNICKARQNVAVDVFDVAETESPDQVSDEFLGKVVAHKKMLTKMLTDFAEEANRRAFANGSKFLERAGLKFVKQRAGNRRWASDADPVEVLGEEVLAETPPPEPLSPTQVEKQLGKAAYSKIEHLVERPEGGQVLAPLDDKRKALPSPDDCPFGDETADDLNFTDESESEPQLDFLQ